MTSNLFEINFDKNQTKKTNELGMREIQARVLRNEIQNIY